MLSLSRKHHHFPYSRPSGPPKSQSRFRGCLSPRRLSLANEIDRHAGATFPPRALGNSGNPLCGKEFTGQIVHSGRSMFLKRRPKEEKAPAESDFGDDAKTASDPAAVLRDELGLHHLWYLELRLQHELARANRSESVFSLVAIELRLLPGEVAGPNLLSRCAAAMAKRFRVYDVVACIDGQRFVAVLLGAPFDQASTVAQRVKSQLQLVGQSAGRWQAGVATYGTDGRDADSLIQAALQRLEEDSIAA